MDRFNHLNFGLVYLALVAAGAVGGGISAAVILLKQHGRRT